MAQAMINASEALQTFSTDATPAPVYVTRGQEVIRPLSFNGEIAAYATTFKGKTVFHIRKFFGETEYKFPTKTGIVLTEAELTTLFDLRDALFSDYTHLISASSQPSDVSNQNSFVDLNSSTHQDPMPLTRRGSFKRRGAPSHSYSDVKQRRGALIPLVPRQ